ncbi:MAG: hypothetical protein IKH19_09225 [Muribaculaceae bacterium]|nr:hypothetical protein [Muribaculaceae bacterium]
MRKITKIPVPIEEISRIFLFTMQIYHEHEAYSARLWAELHSAKKEKIKNNSWFDWLLQNKSVNLWEKRIGQ